MPEWTKQGNKFHAKQVLLSKQRTLSRFDLDSGDIKFEVTLSSQVLGVHGKCDALIETPDQIIPVEIKMGNKIYDSYIMQMVAYGLVAEEKYNKPFRMGFILIGAKAKPKMIKVSPQLRDKCFKLISMIQKNMIIGFMPESSANEWQCSQCEFLNYCNDRF